jgi:hypothetical protein
MKDTEQNQLGDGEKAAKPSSRSSHAAKERYESMKMWFELNFLTDNRADVVVEIERIINVDVEKLEDLPVGRLLNAETKLVQYNLTLNGLVSQIVEEYNFYYVHRKFQYADAWNSMKESITIDAKRITNGEVDNAAEKKVFEERCIETFMRGRADTYQGILDASKAFIRNLQNRIRERDRQLRTPEEHRIYD